MYKRYILIILENRYSDGLQAGRSGFDSRQGEYVSLLHSVQNGSRVHPSSYPMGIEGSFPGGKGGRGMKVTTHLHLVELYLRSPVWLHGIVLN
jgi:hypothetical protein